MHDNHKCCGQLTSKEYCFVVEQYHEGRFERIFHSHAPKYRMSKSAALECLRALVARYFDRGHGMSGEWIVRSHLNSRAGTLDNPGFLAIVVSYNEAGVLRSYCGQNTKAWLDEVVDKSAFEKGREGKSYVN